MNKINHTQVANEYLDKWMPVLTPQTTLVFLAISRKTIGWHKDCDIISLSQLVNMTGLSTNGVKKAIQKLVDVKLVIQTKLDKGNGYKYEINYDGFSSVPSPVSWDATSQKVVCHPVTEGVSSGDTPTPSAVSHGDTTKDKPKETNTKEIFKHGNCVTIPYDKWIGLLKRLKCIGIPDHGVAMILDKIDAYSFTKHPLKRYKDYAMAIEMWVVEWWFTKGVKLPVPADYTNISVYGRFLNG